MSTQEFDITEEPVLNKEQLGRLRIAEENIKAGIFFTQSQADSAVKEWLNK